MGAPTGIEPAWRLGCSGNVPQGCHCHDTSIQREEESDGDTTVAEVPMGGVNYDTTASYIASICNVPKLDDK